MKKFMFEMTQFLKLTQKKASNGIDQPQLKNLFALAYIQLLEAVASNEIAQINSYCEANLYRAFSEGLSDLNYTTQSISVMNQEAVAEVDISDDATFNELFDMEVIDMDQTFGLSIDRASNTRIAFNNVKTKKPNFKVFVPADMQWGDELEMTIRLLVKITTPIKLNLVNKEGLEMISKEDADEREVHFVQFEGTHARYKFDFSIIKQLWGMYNMKSWVIHDWKVTDFDYCLKGNPIMRE